MRHLDTSLGRVSIRKLTCILYLSDAPEGGELRVFMSPKSTSFASLELPHLDITPSFGRMVIFRSEEVEHEVLPTHHERVALTIWAYGDDHGGRWISPNNAIPTRNLASADRPMEGSIFVSIAAYRDSECIPTLIDLFDKANNKSKIFVGVVWQGDGSDFIIENEPSLHVFISQIRVIRMHHRDATGPCLARHIAQSLWRGESYYLQIDSHMRFRQKWDEMLISMLKYCVEVEGDFFGFIT